MTTDTRSPTRAEIAGLISGAFGRGAVHRDQLIAVARAAGARNEALELLARLPSYRYQELAQVWTALPGI